MKIVVLILVFILSGCTSAKVRPHATKVARVELEGSSMLPAFPAGPYECEIELGFCFDDLRVGDTVLFWSRAKRKYLHHRLVQHVPFLGWQTRGDANEWPDPGFMKRNDFIGRTIQPVTVTGKNQVIIQVNSNNSRI